MLPLRLRSRPAASTTYSQGPIGPGKPARPTVCKHFRFLAETPGGFAVRLVALVAGKLADYALGLRPRPHTAGDPSGPKSHPHFWSLLRGQFQRKVPLRPYRRACLLRGCIANIEKSFLAPAWAVLRPNCKTGQLQEAILVYAASLEPVGG